MTDLARGSALAQFLRARRSLVQPADVGLPAGGRRRVAGLRREEVAILAGISTDYYLRLEQGREDHPSDQVLDAIARALREEQNGDYKLRPELSVADVNFVRDFSRNLELAARLTFTSERPGADASNILPERGNASFVLRHSLVALPEPGYQPRRFDPRAGTFGMQVVDYNAPLGRPLVYELATRFRLEKTDPGAARSPVATASRHGMKSLLAAR